MLQINVHFVNGDLMDSTEDDSFWQKLIELQGLGVEGKDLIHDLLTDDWGVPPQGVHIYGNLADGTPVNETIPYSD